MHVPSTILGARLAPQDVVCSKAAVRVRAERVAPHFVILLGNESLVAQTFLGRTAFLGLRLPVLHLCLCLGRLHNHPQVTVCTRRRANIGHGVRPAPLFWRSRRLVYEMW